jgi:hypothetical protein
MTDIVTQVAIDLGLHDAPVAQEDTSWRFNRSHGSLYDRGESDSYYRRAPHPHYGGVGGNSGPRVEVTDPADVAEYMAGFKYNESQGFFKEW